MKYDISGEVVSDLRSLARIAAFYLRRKTSYALIGEQSVLLDDIMGWHLSPVTSEDEEGAPKVLGQVELILRGRGNILLSYDSYEEAESALSGMIDIITKAP